MSLWIGSLNGFQIHHQTAVKLSKNSDVGFAHCHNLSAVSKYRQNAFVFSLWPGRSHITVFAHDDLHVGPSFD